MGSCLEEINHKKLKKGPWTAEEDEKLVNFISKHGYGNWRTLPRRAGLERGGKSCRLRWANYLRPDIKRGNFSPEEEHTIIKLHQLHGNKWSRIATHLPGRTDNEIKNYWNTHIRKKFLQMGMDPKTHKPRTDLSHLLSLCHQLLYCLQHFNNVLLMTNPNSLRLQQPGGGNNDDHDHADQTAQMLPTQLLQNQLLHNILTTTKSLAPNFPEQFLESHHQNPNVNMSSATPEAIHDPLFSAAAHPTDHDSDNVNGVLCEYSPTFDQVNIDNYGQNMTNPFGGPPEHQMPAMQPPEGFSDNQIMQAKTTGVALFDGAWQNLMDEDDETCCSYTGNMLWA